MQSAAIFNPTIHPLGEAVQAGPWQLTLQSAELGDDAWQTMTASNPANDEAPRDLQWVVAWISATNTTNRPLVINVSDFSACGAEGVLYQTPIAMGPEPLLQGSVEPGATLEGAVPFWVGDLSNVLVRFSSPFLGGNWADGWFALSNGATLPTFAPIPAASELGINPSSPARFGDTVRAGDFDVTLQRYATGQAAYDIAPIGVQALGPWDIGNWHSFLLTARNVSSRPKFFSFVSLRLADTAGYPWDHLLALSAPAPDVARELLPGASIEGWASIETQPWASLDVIRVENSLVEGDARFITLSDSAPAALPEPVLDLETGDVVTITTTPLNLRAEPSAMSKIVMELDGTSTLTITGQPIETDSYTWYPVEVEATGESGYVASNFLQLANVD